MTHENYIGIRNCLAQIVKGTVWEGHVYLVGGCVRDEILHDEIHDVDIAVDVVNGGIRFARWLEKKKHTAKGRESLKVFIHFGTAKVKLKMFPGEVIDCVQTRKDKYVYEEHPRPEYNYGTVKEDAMRRDLTINSLYINVSTGELIDPTGMGLSDIENHIIRTPNDPDETLTDNPMHILRCIRFAVRYGWQLDMALIESMKRNVGIIGESTLNRIVKEVTAILALANKDKALQIIEEIGAKQYVDPIIEHIKTMPEGFTAEQHHRRHYRRGGKRKPHPTSAKGKTASPTNGRAKRKKVKSPANFN